MILSQLKLGSSNELGIDWRVKPEFFRNHRIRNILAFLLLNSVQSVLQDISSSTVESPEMNGTLASPRIWTAGTIVALIVVFLQVN